MINKKKFFNYILYAFGEISLIVIGIMLALYLQNRNEEKKIRNNVTTTLKLLKDEILTNKEKIESVKDYHIMIRDTLRTTEMPKTEEGVQAAMGFWKGMRTPRLQDAAFQTSIQSGISKELNPVFLNAINNLYNYQDSYNDFNSQSTQIFFNTDFSNINSIGKTMASVQMTMNDLYYFEKELLSLYEYNIKQMDSIYKAN